MNSVVAQYRATYPRETAGRSDADLTRYLGDAFRARQDFGYEDAYPDFREEYLALKNAGGDVVRETVAAGKAGLLDRLPGTTQGAAALAADALAREELMRGMGLDVPLTAVGESLRGMAKTNREEAAARIQEAGGRTISRVQDVRGVRDAMLYALPTFAENAPSMLASVGAGAAAALATGGGAVPALAAAGASSIAQNAGDVYNELNAEGADRDKAINAAVMAGIPMGLVDLASQAIPLAKLSGLFKGVPSSLILKKLTDVAGRGGVAGAAKGGAVGIISEGGTEAVQEWIQMAAEEYATGKQATPEQIRERLINAAAGGAILGGPVGALTGAIPAATPPPEAPPVLAPPLIEPPVLEAPIPPAPPAPPPEPVPRYAPTVDPLTGLAEGVDAGGDTPFDAALALRTRRAKLIADPSAGLAEGVETTDEITPVNLAFAENAREQQNALQGEAATRIVKLEFTREEDGAPIEMELEAGRAEKMLGQHGRVLEMIRKCMGGAT
jgi:hypothetical protein